MRSLGPVTNNIKDKEDWYVFQINIMSSLMYVIDTKQIEVLSSIYERGKLVEKSGRKVTNLRLSHRGGYGRTPAMEKAYPFMLIPLGRNHPVRGLS